MLSGDVGATGTYSVEGFSGGEGTFVKTESANITSEEGLVLRLHLDVLDGLVKGITTLASDESPEQGTVVSTTGNENVPSQLNEDNTEGEVPWYRSLGSYTSSSWIVIVSIVTLFALVFVLVWKRT